MFSSAHTYPPWIRGTRRAFPEFLWFQDLSPPAVISSERDPTVQEVRSLEKYFSWRYRTSPLPRSKTFMFLGVAGGTIERSCYSPHYVNTERDYERDYQATLPQGRTAADGCKPRHGRDDRKRERSFSGLSRSRAGPGQAESQLARKYKQEHCQPSSKELYKDRGSRIYP